MKVMTILGTRPEIIRLSRIIPLLDKLCDHVVVHTGQNYERTLNEVFFEELDLRKPDYILDSKSESLMEQIGKILLECERVLNLEKPDRILILGDTNSALASFVAKRMGIEVFHMEAGNRCYDDNVPEEVNRRVIDHSSDILMPYSERSRDNLLHEGIESKHVYVIGNPINEVLAHYQPRINMSKILEKLNISKDKYFLATLHRAENVDNQERLLKFIEAFQCLYDEYKVPIICSLHPRTRSQLEKNGIILNQNMIRTIEPVGLFDFVYLEKNALCVLSDSGTVQEECCIFKIPNVTLRDVTERPETLEVGSNIISGCDSDSILLSVKAVVGQTCSWEPPAEYLAKNVSSTVAKILLSKW
ncbi:MAG: non-hydrolyzing UDP-N-acetylglucosamine 2-epimerase [Ignavibacteriales bacterium]